MNSIFFAIEATGQGQNSMTDFSFPCYGPADEVVMSTAADLVKATTGYAFRRFGLDSAQLAHHPGAVPVLRPVAAGYCGQSANRWSNYSVDVVQAQIISG